jgi:hypothetical protein
MLAAYRGHTYQKFQNILESVRILEAFQLNIGIWLAVTIIFVDP